MKLKSYLMMSLLLAMIPACKDDITLEPLEADMKYDVSDIAAGETVQFMDRSKGSPSRWDWEFEGGTPATSQLYSPEVKYERPGTYSVKLTVARGDNKAEKVFENIISVAYPTEMTADFEADVTTAYNTDDVTFTDTSTGYPNQWDWTFTSKDGIVVKSAEQNPVLKFEPGVYSVTLNVSSPSANSSVTKEDYLTVIDHDAVAADFMATSSTMILEGQSVSFADQTMGRPENWKWTFEGADQTSSSEKNPTATYSRAGRYKVTLEAYNEINSSSATKEGYVMVLPKADLSMWFPFSKSLQDMGPNRNIVIKEYSSDTSKWNIDVDAESRHEGDYSVRLRGNCKTNSDGYAILQVDNPELLPGASQAMTFVMWVKADPSAGTQMGLYNRGRPAGAITGDTKDTAQSQEWARLNSTAKSSEGNVRWYINTTDQGSACAANTQDKNLIDNQWHCIIFVKEIAGGKCVSRIYVDGVLSASSASQQAKDTYKDPFFIGCTEQFKAANPHQINVPFNGCMDDLMIYGRALDATEVANLYNIMK